MACTDRKAKRDIKQGKTRRGTDRRCCLTDHLERVRIAPVGRRLRDVELRPGKQLRLPGGISLRVVDEPVGVRIVVRAVHHQLRLKEVFTGHGGAAGASKVREGGEERGFTHVGVNM